MPLSDGDLAAVLCNDAQLATCKNVTAWIVVGAAELSELLAKRERSFFWGFALRAAEDSDS